MNPEYYNYNDFEKAVDYKIFDGIDPRTTHLMQ